MLDTVRKCKRVVRACAKTWNITAWYKRGENEAEGRKRGRKRIHLRSELVKEKYVVLKEQPKTWKSGRTVQSCRSYTCIAADYLKKNLFSNADFHLMPTAKTMVKLRFSFGAQSRQE